MQTFLIGKTPPSLDPQHALLPPTPPLTGIFRRRTPRFRLSQAQVQIIITSFTWSVFVTEKNIRWVRGRRDPLRQELERISLPKQPGMSTEIKLMDNAGNMEVEEENTSQRSTQRQNTMLGSDGPRQSRRPAERRTLTRKG